MSSPLPAPPPTRFPSPSPPSNSGPGSQRHTVSPTSIFLLIGIWIFIVLLGCRLLFTMMGFFQGCFCGCCPFGRRAASSDTDGAAEASAAPPGHVREHTRTVRRARSRRAGVPRAAFDPTASGRARPLSQAAIESFPIRIYKSMQDPPPPAPPAPPAPKPHVAVVIPPDTAPARDAPRTPPRRPRSMSDLELASSRHQAAPPQLDVEAGARAVQLADWDGRGAAAAGSSGRPPIHRSSTGALPALQTSRSRSSSMDSISLPPPPAGGGAMGQVQAALGAGLDWLLMRPSPGPPPQDTPDGTSCPICLSDYADGEHLRGLPCHHEFHRECIDAWLEAHPTCPICRRDLLEHDPSRTPLHAPPPPPPPLMQPEPNTP